jgi:hypothetical protein
MNIPERPLSGGVHPRGVTIERPTGTPSNVGKQTMGQLLFLHRSLAYRNAAAEMMRKARRMPRGSERRAVRRCALALRDLARTEAWLEGRMADGPRCGLLREAEGVR